MQPFQVLLGKGGKWKLPLMATQNSALIGWRLEGEADTKAVLELISCRCTRKCISPKCDCTSNGLKCTDACSCSYENCDNQTDITDSGSDIADSDREYDEISDDD